MRPTDRRRPALTHGWPAVLSVAAVFVTLRLPSLVEPPTFNDEGTYADIGWALDHGAVLYRDVWGHYTPGVYWLGAAINLLHTSVLAFHSVLAAAVAMTALGVWLFCHRFAADSVAWAATVAFVILASLPTLEGDVLYVEVIGALLVVWAVLVIARPTEVSARAATSAGILLASALLFKITFAADAVAVATIPAVIALASGRRPGRQEARTAVLVAAGALALLVAAAAALWLGGSMPGLIDVLTHQDESYLQSVSGGGAAGGVAPSGSAGSIVLLLTITRILVVLAVGTALSWWLTHRRQVGASIAAWWLTWSLAAVVVSDLGLAHYAQQMEPPLCICAALVAARLARRLPVRDLAAAAATTVSAWAVCLAGLIAPTAEASLVVPQPVAAFASSFVSPHEITHYLGRGWQRALGTITPASYRASFGPEPALVRRTVSTITAHSRPAQRVFVWGRVPWAYALSARLPSGRYTSLNSSYTLDPGARRRLISELRAHLPAVLVAFDPLPGAVTAMLHQQHYRRLPGQVEGEVTWVAPARS
jgi:hypothetical protein